MNIHLIISDIRILLVDTFTVIDRWFDKPIAMRSYKPINGGWSIDEVLEHIGLTNHYLLILIEKGTRKALQNAAKMDIEAMLKTYTFHKDQLMEVGIHQSFTWIRPEHMEPGGQKITEEVRRQLKEQITQCLGYLEQLENGEGILYKTTMTVNNLGKIDVYEYIYFLGQHGARHLTQMDKIFLEYKINNI